MNFFLQGSVENRIFASTFYWYGKQLASACPYKSELMFKDPKIFHFFMTHTAAFFDQFPNLHDLHVASDEVDKSANESSPVVRSPLAFARANARSGFKRATNRARKAELRAIKRF